MKVHAFSKSYRVLNWIEKVIVMTDALKNLLEAAKKIEPTAEQREQQRRSFAFGNTAFENKLITREMVDSQAEELAREATEKLARDENGRRR
jgi:hypothetical protein